MSKMAVLDDLALQYLAASNNTEISERRREHQKSTVMFGIMEALKPVVRKISTRKNMLSNEDDIQQHAMIAIVKALETWDHAIASFSTHVHYQIQWELGSFEHYAFPERRRIKVKQPIRFLELDRPIKSDSSESDGCMMDFLVDENAESNIEDSVERNRQLDYLERVMGAYVDIRWEALRKLESGRLTQEREVTNLCRDVDIYLQTRIHGITHASLSVVYEITRERVRQIINKVELAVKDYLPTKNTETDEYDPPVTLYTGNQSDRWHALASWYWHATERDIRHTTKTAILPYEEVLQYLPPIITAECAKLKTEALVVERETAVEQKLAKQAAKRAAKEAAKSLEANNVRDEAVENNTLQAETRTATVICLAKVRKAQDQKNSMPSGKSVTFKQLAMPFMAAAALSATGASAQVSRAIPPIEQNTVTVQTTKPISTPAPTALRKGPEAGTGYGSSWAIKLDAYANKSEVDAASSEYLQEYPALRSAMRASINDQAGKVWLSYGPYELSQAKSLCVEIIADDKKCTVVRLKA